MSFHAVTTKPLHPTPQLLLSAAYYVFLIGGVLALVYSGAAATESFWYQAVEEARLENTGTGAAGAPVGAAAPAIVSEGDVLGVLEAPRIGMKVVVDEGVSDGILRRAVGHIPQTALPGEWGNVVLAGHRDTFFRPLRKIQIGDEITLRTGRGKLQYRVDSTAVVAPTDVRLLKPSEDRMLTLVTCFPFYYVGAAPKRFVVRARLVSFSPHQTTSQR